MADASTVDGTVGGGPTLVDITIMGPVSARRGELTAKLGGSKQRSVLALLAIDAGRVVSMERIIDALWGDDPPDTAAATVQVFVSKLRKALSDLAPGAERAIVTRPPGYQLDGTAATTDRARFATAVAAGRAEARRGDRAGAIRTLGEALATCDGDPLADVLNEPFAAPVRTTLLEERLAATEELVELELADGRHADLVPVLERLSVEHPLREHLSCQLALALYRSGRQADALDRLQRARRTLAEELGLDPGRALRDLESRILNQDAGLELAAAPAATGTPVAMAHVDDPDEALTFQASRATPARLILPDGTIVSVRSPVVVGRHRSVDVVIADPSVSRRHAEVRPSLDRWIVVDLGSTNGTAVNGQKGREHELDDGDRIRVGDVEMVFRLDG